MCGIYGVHATHPQEHLDTIQAMAASMLHRGPDGHGHWHDEQIVIGQTRLAIIDLTAPAGPLHNETGELAVVFNGEIYNHAALRAQLGRSGHIFRTKTDTEVLVHGYEEWGLGLLEHLRGMFAFALWDATKGHLWLVRDRFGQKPLYYTRREDQLWFASEIKALFVASAAQPQVEHAALPYYLTLGYVPPPLTMFAGIHKLAAGHFALYNGESLTIEHYYQPMPRAMSEIRSYSQGFVAVRAYTALAVESQLVSDVPVGAFLSGGVDSSAIVAQMKWMSANPIQTFTAGFEFAPGSYGDQKFNVDAHYAQQVAAHLGTEHHALTISDDLVPRLLSQLIYQMDEPIAQHSIIQTAAIAALARQRDVPVLLSGDAGDELFLGYAHYQADQRLSLMQRLPRSLRHGILAQLFERVPRLQAYAHKLHADDPTTRYLEWMRFMYAEEAADLLDASIDGETIQVALQNVLAPLLTTLETQHFAERIAYASLNLWIPEDSNMRLDKMTMLAGVEARAPLLDHTFVESALGLPMRYKLRGGDTKRVFKDAARPLLPKAVLDRPKWGFIPPTSDWLRTNLRPLVTTVLAPEAVAEAGLCDAALVTRLVDEHLTKKAYHLKSVWALLVLHLWYRLHIRQAHPVEEPLSPQDIVAASHVQSTRY